VREPGGADELRERDVPDRREDLAFEDGRICHGFRVGGVPLPYLTLPLGDAGSASLAGFTAMRRIDARRTLSGGGRPPRGDEGVVAVALVVRQAAITVGAAASADSREFAAATSAAPFRPGQLRRRSLVGGGVAVAAGAVGAAVALRQRRRQRH